MRNSRIVKVATVLSLSLLLSCAAKMGFVPPETGVTEQFFRTTGAEFVNLATYDFSKLKNGYGLYVFSYEFEYSDDVIAKYPDGERGKKGTRVWEYQFTQEKWDTKLVEVNHQFWRTPDKATGGLTSHGYNLTMHHEYRKGRIVYGGRLRVDFDTFFDTGPEVLFAFDEDMGGWLSAHSSVLDAIEIDTVLMSAGY